MKYYIQTEGDNSVGQMPLEDIVKTVGNFKLTCNELEVLLMDLNIKYDKGKKANSVWVFPKHQMFYVGKKVKAEHRKDHYLRVFEVVQNQIKLNQK